ncbi:MAG: glycosyltransferase family 39 protein [Bacteroidales bacterium]|nr:glycosyltransferase family 39 protein [Bacteroidales bacterium]
MLSKDQLNIIILFFLVIISRIFFIWEGYGIEEDSWGLVLNSMEISSIKEYIISRMPGHPVQELLLAVLWNINHSPEIYNGLSGLFSLIVAIYFYLILKELRFKNPLLASSAMVLTPVIYIASTYTIDYIWALAFIMMSYYYILRNRNSVAGILLGLAIGCRITAGAMIIPFLFTILVNSSRNNLRHSIVFAFMCVVTALITFLPVIIFYGIDSINYYELPYPPVFKALYKGTIGVWGAFSSIIFALIIFLFLLKQKLRPYNKSYTKNVNHLLFSWILAIILYFIAYFKYPEKSAFLIPVIPFIILLFGYLLKPGYFKILAYSLIISSFFISIDLTDRYRGAGFSDLAVKFNISGQEIFIDVLNGPIFSDKSKRINKQNFTNNIVDTYNGINKKTVIICGWWYNQLKVNLLDQQRNNYVRLVSYVDENQLKEFIRDGYKIKHLPEQDISNDSKFFSDYTSHYSSPLLIEMTKVN